MSFGSSVAVAANSHKKLGLISAAEQGAVQDGVTNDAAAVIDALALNATDTVLFTGPCYIGSNAAQSAIILSNLHRLNFLVRGAVLQLPDCNGVAIAPTETTEFCPSHLNLSILGVDTATTTASAVSQTVGSAKQWTLQFTLASVANIDVGDAVFIDPTAGTGDYLVVGGMYIVTAKGASTIDVVSPFADSSWPTLTLSAATVTPIKTLVQWPSDRISMRVQGGGIREWSKICCIGSYDPALGTPSDGPDDGLQIGSAPDTSETGLNESEQSNSGCFWASLSGWLNLENNAVQNSGGSGYFTSCAFMGSGWRANQAARSGCNTVKRCFVIGNNQGLESEEGGHIGVSNGGCVAGNIKQGLYAIVGTITSSGLAVLYNLESNVDARNGAHIVIDGANIKGGGLYNILIYDADVTCGASATVASDAGTFDVLIGEGGSLNGSGASSLGASWSIDHESGAQMIDTDGDLVRPISTILVENNGHNVSINQSSIGDGNIAIDGSNVVLIKSNGTVRPTVNNSQDIGANGSEWRNAFIANSILMRSPDNTLWTIKVDNTGTVSVT